LYIVCDGCVYFSLGPSPWSKPSVYSDVFCTLDSQRHPLRLYLEYVGHLYQKMDPLPEQERFEVVILPYVYNIGMA